MANFYFFTDADATGVLNAQDEGHAFGAISDTEFRVTSLHTASSTPRAFAICEGKVAVQQDSQSHLLNLILKPKDQPGVGNQINFVPIKYFIYKGIVKASLISGLNVADESKNQLTFRAHRTQDALNRAAEALLDEPANSLTLTPSADLFGYGVGGNDTESLDKLFYKPDNSLFEPLTVYAGDYIGDFGMTLFGLEIVLDEVRAGAGFMLTRDVETRLVAPAPTADNDSRLFKRRHQKEAALWFMDPCAFFGSFFQYGGLLPPGPLNAEIFNQPFKLRYRLSTDDIDVETGAAAADLHTAKGEEIYENLLVHFFNRNAVYIDIRNELNTSLNFYQHYDNHLKLTFPHADDATVEKDYYGVHGWPLLVLRPADFDPNNQNADSDEAHLKIEIALPNPSGENASPLVYISQGYRRVMKRNKVLRGEKRYVPLDTADDYTTPFSVVVANISGASSLAPVSQYIRIKYLKAARQGASSGIVPRASHYLDHVFMPFRMKIPFAVTANSKSRIYNEDVYVDAAGESGCRFAAAVGIAQDAHNFTLLAYAGDKLATTGTNSQQTVSLTSEAATESHYLNLLRDRYKREKLFQGTLTLTTGAAPFPTYLRFADSEPGARRDSSFANLSDEFVAVLISADNFAEMRIEHDLSNDYDIFMRFENEHEDVTTDGIVYVEYDLVLEGYKDDGTSISLDTFDTGIKAYSFGKDHHLILVDGDATFDVSTPLDELPACTGAFSQDELGYLQKFIKDTKDATGLFKALWTNAFNVPTGAGINVTGGPDDGGGPYVLFNPFLPATAALPLPKGFLAEACTLFTLYRLRQQLIADTAATQDSVDVDHPNKSVIYKALKEILISRGFRKPAPGAETHEFNAMMNPDQHIGQSNVSAGADADDKVNAFINQNPRPVKRVMYELMKPGNLSPPASDRKFDFGTGSLVSNSDILVAIDGILKHYAETIARLVEDGSSCAYRILSGETEAPTNLYLATGDGTPTKGLFNRNYEGVLLFNYTYDGTGGVRATAQKDLRSRSEAVATVVHFTMFGLELDDESTVTINKDGLGFRFKASASVPITPVNGDPAAKLARYNSTGNYFYKDTESGPLALASYDPAKRELTFFPAAVGGLFSFEVAQSSGNSEEFATSINIVAGEKIRRFNFEAENLFLNDEFVLDPVKRGSLLAAPRYTDPVNFMIDRLINVPNIPIFIRLEGNFVGQLKEAGETTTGARVKEDKSYQFHLARPDRSPEVVNDDPAYASLRYSFGSVVITQFNIFITINSFVSPRWSRLDNKVPSGKKQQLNSLTHYYTILNSDAYVDHVGAPPLPDFPHLPSYNPILSALRSFGLAEALKEILVERATAAGYPAGQVTSMGNHFQSVLAAAVVLQNPRLGIAADVTFSHYTDFKA